MAHGILPWILRLFWLYTWSNPPGGIDYSSGGVWRQGHSAEVERQCHQDWKWVDDRKLETPLSEDEVLKCVDLLQSWTVYASKYEVSPPQSTLNPLFKLLGWVSDDEVDACLPQVASLLLALPEMAMAPWDEQPVVVAHPQPARSGRFKDIGDISINFALFTKKRICDNMFMGIKLCWLLKAAQATATEDQKQQDFWRRHPDDIYLKCTKPETLLQDCEEVMEKHANWPKVMRVFWKSYYDYSNQFLADLMNLSYELARTSKEERREIFERTIKDLNNNLETSGNEKTNWLHLPAQLLSGSKEKRGKVWRLLRLEPEECHMLPSRERCPLLVTARVLETQLTANSTLVYVQGKAVGLSPMDVMEKHEVPPRLQKVSMTDWQDSFVRNQASSWLRYLRERSASERADDLVPAWTQIKDNTQFLIERKKEFWNTFGELDSELEGRLLAPPGAQLQHDSHYLRLARFIVKAGDDLRLEQLAMQVLGVCDDAFKKIEEEDRQNHLAHLAHHGYNQGAWDHYKYLGPWLKPYMIICSGEEAGLIECISDCRSVDYLKKKGRQRDLGQYFDSVYGPWSWPIRRQAAFNFARSLAGYSLFSYLLQIKDRHNANIMIDKNGHIIHIDFGFILGLSPGLKSMKFETAHFKMTDDYVNILGGFKSEAWQVFESAFVRGYRAIQKILPEVANTIKLMESSLQQINVKEEIDNMNQRMSLQSDTEIKALITQSQGSHMSWTTYLYDKYQKQTNNIHY